MKISAIPLALVFAVSSAHAGTPGPMDYAYCEMVGDIANQIAQNRNDGVTYRAELAYFEHAQKTVPAIKSLNYPIENLVKALYFTFPKVSPKEAYKIIYTSCLKNT